LIFASKVCKTQNLTQSFLQKRNTNIFGTGQTSRVDALLQDWKAKPLVLI
jgi:hypothetical protein